MTEENIIKLVSAQAKMANIPVNDKAIKDALALAGPFAWKSYGWKFRRKETTLATTGSQEYAELPDDFGGFSGLRHRSGSSEGWQLEYHDEDTYEYAFPNPDLISSDAPKRIKIVKDADTDTWRAYFNPEPDTTYNLTLIYLTDYGGLTSFPQGFEGLVMAATWLFLHPVGTDAYNGALAAYKVMREDAVTNLDPVYRAEPGQTRRAKLFDVGDGAHVADDWYTISDGSDY